MVETWERVESHRLADHRVLRVRQDVSRLPRTGEVHEFCVLEMPEWVNIIALTPEDRVVMIRQYRHGTGEIGLEIPGGAVDEDDVYPAEAARRELVEETGYEAEQILPLGKVAPNPALQNNRCHSFLALGARPVRKQRLDEGEDIEVEEIDLGTIPDLIGSGVISHGLVVVAFYFWEQYRTQNLG